LVDGVTVAVKSTVPVGEGRRIQEALRAARPDLDVAVVSNPEFLSQGRAVADFMQPDRIVVGADDPGSAARVLAAYRSVVERGVPTVSTGLESAELVKYASNAFLATKLSFINEIADLCETAGARIDDVAVGIGLDARIGPAFLRAGPGFGGSCLPKDTAALRSTIRSHGTSSHIVHAALEVNRSRVARMSDRILGAARREPATVCLLGAAFKPGTDDVRESPAIAIAAELVARGSSVRVFDPHAMDRAAAVLGSSVEFAVDAYEAATGADVVVVATDWPEFAALDFSRIAELVAGRVVVDLRNLLDHDVLAAAGFTHLGIGRPDPV
jgi:UDPglucose 6-dehydrogenase